VRAKNANVLSVGGEVRDQTESLAYHAVIAYEIGVKQFVFSARKFTKAATSYICQLQQGLTVQTSELFFFQL